MNPGLEPGFSLFPLVDCKAARSMTRFPRNQVRICANKDA